MDVIKTVKIDLDRVFDRVVDAILYSDEKFDAVYMVRNARTNQLDITGPENLVDDFVAAYYARIKEEVKYSGYEED